MSFSIVTIEYEVRPEDNAQVPNILVVDDLGLEEYQIRANSYPITDGPLFSPTIINVPWYGKWEFPYGYNSEHLHLKNIPKKGRSLNDWGEKQELVDYYTVECLTSASSDAVRMRQTIEPEPGNYYVVFDWTDDILREPDTERVSAQVSLWATEPIDEFASTHLAILASTGSGKSYTPSVLIEEMMQPDSRAALLVFDPHGEYDTLEEMRGVDSFRGEDGYEPEVDYFDPDRLRVRISELELGDVMAVLDDLSNRMQERLAGGWRAMQRQESRTWGVDDLVDEMYDIYDEDDASVGALEWRLRRSIQRNELFQPDANVPLDELVAPGRCTVLQMDTLDRRNQQMIATVLLRRLYRARLDDERGRESKVDFPLFALFEEGHRFAPGSGDAPSLGIMRTITSEGRKFGFGLGIISQRPSKIDQDTLSQCGTQISMQIQNPNDQEAIKNSVEAAGEDVLRELPGLTPGQAVVSGDAMNTPVLIRVRERHTSHGAESLTATEDWREAYDAREREPASSERADFGGGESTGVEDLD